MCWKRILDVCYETSGRNSGVVHGGFAYDVGTLKAKLCVEGNQGMDELSRELGFVFKRCGKVLVGKTPEDLETLKTDDRSGRKERSNKARLLNKEELHGAGSDSSWRSLPCSRKIPES